MFIKRIVCGLLRRHEYRFLQNIYGDEINLFEGRSMWECHKCGLLKTRQTLKEVEV